jgi:hypothetical protein
VVLASRNQCEQWAAATECVTNARYSCVCGLLCVFWGSLTSCSISCVRVSSFSAQAGLNLFDRSQ